MNTNVNIVSGFLGAGKTTFLKKILPNLKGKVALIENEFGDIGIDGDLIEGNIPIREIYAGCICCSLTQDFKKGIEDLVVEYQPDHIFIEPSGVGNLSDIIKVCIKISQSSNFNIKINHLITIVDVSAFEDYLEVFGNFYLDQIQNANIIFLSHLGEIDQKKAKEIIAKIRLNNDKAFILEDDWHSYDGEKIIQILDDLHNFQVHLKEKPALMPADKVFSTLSVANPKVFSEEEFNNLLAFLKKKENGFILRAKGVIELERKEFVYFDFTPHHFHFEYTKDFNESKVAIIGNKLNKRKISGYFSNKQVSKTLSRYIKS